MESKMMSLSLRLILTAVVLLVLGNGALMGQNILSSIVGHITDASGAATPAARVTVTNEGTGISVEVTSDTTGTYVFPDLYAGVYTIQVKKEGFEAVRIAGISVLAAQTVRQDVVLKVGAVTQSVTVTAVTPLVHTDSINVAGEINTRQLSYLPIQTQSIDTLLKLVPGAGNQAANQPQIGGSNQVSGVNFNINGIAANDSSNGRGLPDYGLGLEALPPLSSMQEFKVETNSMSAEYRNETTVDMVTKQGSNKFHGEAYEYNQNAKLQASTLTLNAAGKTKPPYNLNQFGANVGGPIWKNKAFFFFNFSGWRQRSYSTVQENFPSLAMQGGNFSALCSTFVAGICASGAGTQLYNPLTGAAFAGNVIPASMITSQAKVIMSYIPPNTTSLPGLPNAAPDYVGLVSAPKDFDVYDLRLDYQLSAKDSLTGYFNHNRAFPYFVAQGTPPTYGNMTDGGSKVVMYHLAWAHSFGSNTINDIRLGWLNFPENRSGQNLDFDPTSLFPQQVESAQRGVPKMSYTGYAGVGDLGSRHLASYQPSMEIQENFTHVHGRHTLKAGADLSDYAWFVQSSYAVLPAFSFSGVWTGNKGNPGQPTSVGNAFADFLLGDAVSSSTSSQFHDGKWYDKDWELYVQDTWQATPKLTVYYGVRYMNQMPWTLRDNLWSNWNRSTNQIIVPQNSSTPTFGFGMSTSLFNAFLPYLTTSQALGRSLNLVNDDSNNWGPRLGFAFRPFANGKTVLRGGYGVYYAGEAGEVLPFNLTLNPPWAGNIGGSNASNEIYTSALPGTPKSQFLPDITFSNPFPSSSGGLVAASSHPSLYGSDPNFVLPVLQSWNLTVERQIGTTDMVRVSYVGSQAHHMDTAADQNTPVTQTPNVPTQTQRPYQPWASIALDSPAGKQNFDQLEVEYIRHFAKGLGVQAEYSWTRALTNIPTTSWGATWQNPHNEKAEYAEQNGFPRHRLAFNYIYSLPVGRGRRYMSNARGVVDGFLGGWQVTGITIYQTGSSFSVGFQVPSTYVGWWGGRADRLSGVDPYAKQSGHNITKGVQWFNPSAFAPPQPWTWGDSQAYSLWGPGSDNWDIGLQKSFRVPIRGLEAPRLTFRTDWFDALNHFTPGNPSATIADTRDGGSPITTAGMIYSGSGNRTIQLGLTFEF